MTLSVGNRVIKHDGTGKPVEGEAGIDYEVVDFSPPYISRSYQLDDGIWTFVPGDFYLVMLKKVK